ncbi:MAG TPA: site-specific integrase, partial [Dehalococcoidia bacterium]|nr:site-specific integrase [Dehalococcoidia bacterium]
MRAGSAFRRCTKDGCRANVAASVRACPKCGGHSLSWAFVIDLALPGSKRKQRFGSGFATKAAALEAMNRLQAAVVDGTHVERSRRTLGAYLEDWLAARSDIRANTARDYSVSIHNHIGPRLGDVPLQVVDRLRIRGLYRQLAGSGLGEKTVHNVHICLRKALQDAVDDGLLRRNPAERAHAKPKDRPEMRTWSADELATFLSFTAQDRELALYHVAAATGMRRGELLGLRWRDVDLAGVRLSVRQQYTRQGKSLGFGPPKSAKSIRTIDLDDETVDLLREQRERQLFERRKWGKAYRTDLDLVFCRPGGIPEDPNVIGRRFSRRIRDLAGLPAIGLHGLRHTHATLLLEEGVDVKTVSERLGHDSVQTTLEL